MNPGGEPGRDEGGLPPVDIEIPRRRPGTRPRGARLPPRAARPAPPCPLGPGARAAARARRDPAAHRGLRGPVHAGRDASLGVQHQPRIRPRAVALRRPGTEASLSVARGVAARCRPERRGQREEPCPYASWSARSLALVPAQCRCDTRAAAAAPRRRPAPASRCTSWASASAMADVTQLARTDGAGHGGSRQRRGERARLGVSSLPG